ncbi:hypothetical protein GOQ29_13475 [Clostridium sp. D2Q-14]|uniref:hypothetical protein n=1 Tax=Anaeromonas gelatinilytica TaxID=2683194 RepID=UPI00193B3160|nr:hypothetical protein [Anaeromonas gelatinilytica]MBS4536629.1 hypothetical protein [Anaeromonas gelatinilytica]
MSNNFGYMFNRLFYDESVLNELEKYSSQYENISDSELYVEIERVQKEVPNEIKAQHMKNLESLSQMNMFSEGSHSSDISHLRNLVEIDESNSYPSSISRSQYVSGSSLLLWFLLVVALWRRPFGRRGFRRKRGFGRYPYY